MHIQRACVAPVTLISNEQPSYLPLFHTDFLNNTPLLTRTTTIYKYQSRMETRVLFWKGEKNMSEHDNENLAHVPTTPRKKRVVKAALIDHSYSDYSTYQITNADSCQQNGPNSASFPQKLHYILSRLEYRHIISWMPHGRAWRILDKKLLVSMVCKEQFKHEKFESFNRQVNGWGFKVRK